MRQKLNPRKIKRNRSYTVKELAQLYGVHPNTVRSWIKNEGLPSLDGAGREMLLHWAAIREWIVQRNKSRKWSPAQVHELSLIHI